MIYEITVKPNSKKGPLVVADGDRLTVFLRENRLMARLTQLLLRFCRNTLMWRKRGSILSAEMPPARSWLR